MNGKDLFLGMNYVNAKYVPYKIGKLQIQGFSEPATQKIK